MAPVKTPSTRTYRSAVRAEAAARTRRSVVEAAARLFAGRGYAATSLADIAAEAGVARPTVFAAFGSKPGLLREVLDQALAGDDEPVPVAERAWFRPVWDARRPADVLAAYAAVCTEIGARAGRLFEVVRRAADDAPEVADLWSILVANRRAGAAMVVDHVLTRGGVLPAGLDRERAVDVLWLLNDPAHYEALVGERKWSEDAFRDWLGDRMVESVLGARRTRARAPRPTATAT
jgi:AcrR family transcriptional regulator